MTTDFDRSERRRARQVRRRRQRLVGAAVALGALGAGAGAIMALGGGGGPSTTTRAAPAPPPPESIRYAGSKLAPKPHRRGELPTLEQQRSAVQRLHRLGLPILCGGHRGRYIALTFDDGPGEYTELALKILRKRHMRATWFIVGSRVAYYPSLPAREAQLGALGDHTWTHPYLPGLSDAAIREQIRSTRDVLRTKADVLLFRPPYGGRDARVDRIATSLGLLQVLWSVDSGDSTGSDVKGVYRNVLAGLKPGAIILMHENRATTIKSLIHYVLPEIQRRKLKPVSVPELLALDPPSAAQVRSRKC